MRALLLIAVWLVGVAQAALPALEFDSFTIRSQALQEQRTIWVGIPENYRQSRSSYPVLYATDAESKLIDLAAATRFSARNRRMPPALIVGIVNTARTRDLTPTAWRFDGSGFRPESRGKRSMASAPGCETTSPRWRQEDYARREKATTGAVDVTRFRQGIQDLLRRRLIEAVEVVVREELAIALGSSRHERTEGRLG